MLAPAMAFGMHHPTVDPLSVICHAGGGSSQKPAPTHHHAPTCDHCLLCHAVAGGLPPDGRPVFTRLDHPVASPLRWRHQDPLVVLPAVGRDAQPRGPPILF